MHAMYYLHDITFSHAVRQVSCLTSVMLQQMCLHSQLCHSVMSFATVAQSCVLSPLLCSAASTENCVFSFHCHHAVIHRHSSICCYKHGHYQLSLSLTEMVASGGNIFAERALLVLMHCLKMIPCKYFSCTCNSL